jgi:hypothetical protein
MNDSECYNAKIITDHLIGDCRSRLVQTIIVMAALAVLRLMDPEFKSCMVRLRISFDSTFRERSRGFQKLNIRVAAFWACINYESKSYGDDA